MIYGYARCSTNEDKQDIRRQVRELKAADPMPLRILFLLHFTAIIRHIKKDSSISANSPEFATSAAPRSINIFLF